MSVSFICNDKNCDLFYSACLHRNLHWPQLTQKNPVTGFGKMTMKGPGRQEFRKEEIPDSRGSMPGHTPTYSQLFEENLRALGFQTRGPILCILSIHCRTLIGYRIVFVPFLCPGFLATLRLLCLGCGVFSLRSVEVMTDPRMGESIHKKIDRETFVSVSVR